MTTLTMTILRCAGIVQRDPSPLAAQPFRIVRFGTPDAQVERELIDVREVDALFAALKPHVDALLAYSAGTDAPHIEEARKALDAMFNPPPEPVERPAPRLVTA